VDVRDRRARFRRGRAAAPLAAGVAALAGRQRAGRGGRRGRAPVRGRRARDRAAGARPGAPRAVARPRVVPRAAGPTVPQAHRDDGGVPPAAELRLLRVRHARAAGARGQGLPRRAVARVRGADVPRLPGRVAAVAAAGRTGGAQGPARGVRARGWRCSGCSSASPTPPPRS
jgi:hypothetical protein